MNVCHFLGRLTKDTDLRNINGSSVVNFDIAISRKYKTRDNKKAEEVCFLPCEAWGSGADTIAQYFKKGDPIIVHGSMKQENWESDGQKRSRLVLRVTNFEFIPGTKNNSSGGDTSTESAPASTGGGGSVSGGSAGAGGDDEIPF
jgi:single-strand DNA-binding protein